MTPDVNFVNGAIQQSIPLPVPPGRAGMQPNLSLIYNNSQRNGWVGVGWDLSLGSIVRANKIGPNCQSDDFYFSLNGALMELQPRAAFGANCFGMKIEQAFTKYCFDANNDVWTAKIKDGTKMTFTRAITNCRWDLVKVEDVNGNYMSIEYTAESKYRYIDKIRYTGHPHLAPMYTVNFIRESRPDNPTSWPDEIGPKTVMQSRLSGIEVWGANSQSYLQAYKLEYSDIKGRSYLQKVKNLGRTEDPLKAMEVATFGYTQSDDQLNYSITDSPDRDLEKKFGFSGDFNADGHADFFWCKNNVVNTESGQTDCVTAVKNKYGTGFTFVQPFEEPHFKKMCPDIVPILKMKIIAHGDFNQDNLTDFVMLYHCDVLNIDDNSKIRVYLSNGDGTFSWQYGGNTPYDFDKDIVYAVGDFDGDGTTTDFLYAHQSKTPGTDKPLYAYLSKKQCQADSCFDVVETDIHLPSWSSSTRFWSTNAIGDFNGDGKTDVMFSFIDNVGRFENTQGQPRTYLSNGNGTFSLNPDAFPLLDPDLSPTYDNNYKVQAQGDFNADGKTDIVVGHNTNTDGMSVKTYIILYAIGDGGFHPSCNLVYLSDSRNIITSGDFNGDGLTDLVFSFFDKDGIISGTDTDSAKFYIEYSNGGCFDHGPVIQHTLGRGKLYYTGDFFGTGKDTFLLWRQKHDHGGVSYSQLSKLFKPDETVSGLLDHISNGRGGIISLSYKASSKWDSTKSMPFVMQLVDLLKTHDTVTDKTTYTRYDFAGGYYDAVNREFMGFEKLKITRYNDYLFTQYKFHQDAFRRGKPYETTIGYLYGPELSKYTPLKKSTATWKIAYIDSNQTSAFAWLYYVSDITYDGNGGSNASHKYFDYDINNGNLIATTLSGFEAEKIRLYNTYIQMNNGAWRKKQERIFGLGTGTNPTQEIVRQITFDYSPNGNLRSQTNWNNNGPSPTTTYIYDMYGNNVGQTDPKGNTRYFIYDTQTHTHPVKITYPTTNGVTHETKYAYNPDGRISWSEDEKEIRTEYYYDDYNRLAYTTQSGSNGSTTEYTYSPTGMIPSYIKKSTIFSSDSTQSVLQTTTYYAGFGKAIQTSAKSENNQFVISKSYAEFTCNDIYKENCKTVEYVYGPYFANNDAYQANLPTTYPWQKRTSDALTRVLKIEVSDGQYGQLTTSYTYNGFTTNIADPDGKQKSISHDYLGRTIKVTENGNDGQYVTHYDYNAAGDLLGITDHFGHLTIMSYDTLGRKIMALEPNMGFWRYAYDLNGNLTEQIDSKGQKTTFKYDALGRTTQKKHYTLEYQPVDPVTGQPNPLIPGSYCKTIIALPELPFMIPLDCYHTSDPFFCTPGMINCDGDPTNGCETDPLDPPPECNVAWLETESDIVYTYDDPNVPNGKGRLYATTNHNASTTCEVYDTLGNCIEETITIDGQTYTTKHKYDASGRLNTITYPNDMFVKYDYHTNTNLLKSVTIKNHIEGELLADCSYTDHTAFGQAAKIECSNGVTTEHFFDDKSGRLKRILTTTQSETIQDKRYTYTKAGDVKSITDAVKNANYTYEYDNLHRLLSETSNDNSGPIKLTYNAIGNIMTKNMGADKFVFTYDPVKTHAIKKISLNNTNYTYTYDQNGNMLSGPDFTDRINVKQRTFTYNIDNLPTSITSGINKINLAYDGYNRRIKKTTSNGETTYYINSLFEETSGAYHSYIFANGERVAMLKNDQLYFFHKDMLGSTTTTTDGSGQIIDSIDYYPFGSPRTQNQSQVSDYRFTDQEEDTEIGLYNYDARMYDPVIGRFVTPDPYFFHNPELGIAMPIDLNLYAYARNNPLIFIDPTGYWSWKGFAQIFFGSVKIGLGVAACIAGHPWAGGWMIASGLGDVGGGIATMSGTPTPNLVALGVHYFQTEYVGINSDDAWAYSFAIVTITDTVAGYHAGYFRFSSGTGASSSSPVGYEYVLNISAVFEISTSTAIAGVAIGSASIASGVILSDADREKMLGGAPGGGNGKAFKEPKPGATGKSGATDIPSWAKGSRPYKGESGTQYAKRMMDSKYGSGNWSRSGQQGREFSQLKKYADRHFE